MIKNNELVCNSCGKHIIWDVEYVKKYLLYAENDWHQCLCIDCTLQWKRAKELAEAHPNFGKRVGFKMVCVDEFHDSKKIDMKF